MLAAELYDWLKAFHVLFAVIWVGGGITLQVVAIRLRRENDHARMAAFAGDVEWIGGRVFAPASGLVLILGIWMVIDQPAWTFGQFWILAALAMFAYSFVNGAFVLGPQAGRLKTMFETEGPSPATTALVNRLFVLSRIELVLLVLIVFDMVLKPGL
jgi:uncharacterized membrane protein